MIFKKWLGKSNFGILIRDRVVLISFILSFLLNLFIWLFLYFKIKPSPNPIFLHYNIYFGVDLIGPWWRIYLLPLTGILALFINFIISAIIYDKEKILSYFLMIIAGFLQVFLILSAIFIVGQNL